MGELDWKHHAIIQSMLSRGPLKESSFHSLFADLTGKSANRNQQLFNDYIRKINKELAYVQFELRGCRNQYDGEVYYGVVNTVGDDKSKLGTKYSVPQIAFFKAVIEAILQDSAGRGSIPYISALNVRLDNQVRQASQASSSQLPSAFRQFSLSQKERTLQDLMRDKWLCTTADGSVGIGVRSFFDLRSWFRNNDFPSCNVCNEAGIKAEACPNENCTLWIHMYCLEKQFSQNGGQSVCPSCGFAWPYDGKAAQEDELKVPSPDAIGSPTMTKRVRSCRTGATTDSSITRRLRSRNIEPDAKLVSGEGELKVPSPDAAGSPAMTKRVRSCRATAAVGSPDVSKRLRRCKVETEVDGAAPMQKQARRVAKQERSLRSTRIR